MKIETVLLAGQNLWGIMEEGYLTDAILRKTEEGAAFAARLYYQGHKVLTTKDPEHYSNTEEA